MSMHSFTKCWIHFIWNTKNHERIIDLEAAAKISDFLHKTAKDKAIYMKVNYVNLDHVHVLMDMPSSLTLENAAKLFKGSSSHWINQERIIPNKFSWGRGYGAFSVSQSAIEKVAKYIKNQREHHRRISFTEEYESFLKAYNIDTRK